MDIGVLEKSIATLPLELKLNIRGVLDRYYCVSRHLSAPPPWVRRMRVCGADLHNLLGQNRPLCPPSFLMGNALDESEETDEEEQEGQSYLANNGVRSRACAGHHFCAHTAHACSSDLLIPCWCLTSQEGGNGSGEGAQDVAGNHKLGDDEIDALLDL